jgi:hypothetical protein
VEEGLDVITAATASEEKQDTNADDLVFEGNFDAGDYELWFDGTQYKKDDPSNTAMTYVTVRVSSPPEAN